MKIAQFSDLHYCPEHLEEVDKCFRFAIDEAIDLECQAAVISGDLFDKRVEVHQPAVSALLDRVRWLANHMPVLILQGTFSHDQPGSLDVFKTIGGQYPVHVSDRIEQVALKKGSMRSDYVWQASPDWTFSDLIIGANPAALFSCMPPVHKGAIAAAAGEAENTAALAGEHVYNVMKGWGIINAQANKAGIPTVIVSHGTVNGCTTEHGVPMHGQDHEFTTGALFASQAQAIMLGHIHQHQAWCNGTSGQVIAYPGSIGRLHFGEMSDKGFLIWRFDGSGVPEFIETPAKQLVQVEFEGAPDMAQLQEIADANPGAHVRIRWTIDEEHRNTVDKEAIAAMFPEASEVKLEGRIRPVQRQRAAGITKATGIEGKLYVWSQATGSPGEPLLKRLRMLHTSEPEAIAASILEPEINK